MSRENDQSIESIVKSLESIIILLEDDGTSLDEAMQGFEQGIALTRNAQQLLTKAEQKIQVFRDQREGNSLQAIDSSSDS